MPQDVPRSARLAAGTAPAYREQLEPPSAPIAARLAALPAASTRLLELICVGGAPLAHEALAHAAGLDRAAYAASAGALVTAHLIATTGNHPDDTAAPVDDRVRAAVLGELPAAQRRRHHEQLAEALECRGGATREPVLLVHHLAAAGLTVRAADLARRAAPAAIVARDHDQAAALLDAALRLGPGDDAQRRELELALAEALARAGRRLAAAAAYLAAAEGVDEDARLDYHLRAGHHLICGGETERGLEIFDGLLAVLGVDEPRTGTAAWRALSWRWGWLRMRARWRVRDHAEIPARDRLRLDVFRTLATDLALVDSGRGAGMQARSLVEVLRLGDPRRIAHAMGLHAIYLGGRGGRHLLSAGDLVGQARRIAAELDDPALETWAQVATAMLDALAGRHLVAIRALETITPGPLDDEQVASELEQARVFHLFCLRRTGDLATLGELADRHLREAAARGDRQAEIMLAWSANIAWLAADDVPRARRDQALDDPPTGSGYQLRHWLAIRARIELALYTLGDDGDGDAREALIALDDQLSQALASPLGSLQVVRAESLWLRARLALARGDLQVARTTARRLARERIGYATAWALLVDAAIVANRAPQRETIARLGAAAAAARAAEMPILAAIAGRRAGELEGGDAGMARMIEADRWLHSHGVAAPARFADLIAPGFPTPGVRLRLTA